MAYVTWLVHLSLCFLAHLSLGGDVQLLRGTVEMLTTNILELWHIVRLCNFLWAFYLCLGAKF